MKRLLALFIFASACFAQQPQTQTAPIFRTNAKYTNGVAPGYWPTAGTGLTLNLSAGTAFCGNAAVAYAAGTLTMTNTATNYVFLDTTASCAPTSNTTGFLGSTIPIATVVTSGGAITSITDDRTMFFAGSAAVSINAVPNPQSRVWSYLTSSGANGPSTASAQVIGDSYSLTGTGSSSGHIDPPYGGGEPYFKNGVFYIATGATSTNPVSLFGNLLHGTGSNLLWESDIALSSITNIRLRVGFCVNNTVCTTSDSPTVNEAAFRFSTSAGDSHFQCETGDGTSQTDTDSGIAPVASANNATATVFALKIQFNDAVPNVVFTINGSTVCTNTTHLPLASTALKTWLGLETLTNATETMFFPFVYTEGDTK